MKRAIIAMTILAVMAVAGAIVYQSEAREREYRLLLAQGDAALAADQTFAAIEDFSGAIALRPDSMLAHLRRGETYQLRGDLDSAARDFRTAASLDPTATRPLEQWADALYEQQRYRRAVEVYEARLRLDDRSALVRYRLALALYRDGQCESALKSLGEAIRLDSKRADAHYLMSLCYREAGNTRQAIEALDKAVSLAPGSVPAREELADLRRARGERTAEIEQLQILAALDGQIERRVALGLAHARAGHADLAVLTLASAIEQWPNQPSLYGALGKVWLDIARTRQDRPDALGKALEALERAASSPNATSEVKTLYGQALFRDGQIEAAERVLQQATERFPAYPEAFASYATVAEQQGHPGPARAALLAYHGLVGDDTGFPARAVKLGELSLAIDEPAVALAWLKRADSAIPGNHALVAPMADAHIRLGNLEEARALLTRGLETDPSNRSLRTLLREVTTLERQR